MAGAFVGGDPFRRLFWTPRAPIDWIETPTSHIIKIDVPGLSREDIKVQLEEGNVLHIRGDAPKAKEEKDAVWHISERRQSDFERRLALPDGVRAEQTKAQVENGVLTLVVPKEPIPPKHKSKIINVTSKL